MKNAYFEKLEKCIYATELNLSEVANRLSFNEQGLVPVISQDKSSKRVLMLAWMDKTALLRTLSTGRMTYWSRSRNQFWIKGETSGKTQTLIDMSIDCDGDTILCQVDQKGGACHTGRNDCFYLEVDHKRWRVSVPAY
jgi:phosphoribosyl-AMP cyclohydrolase